MARLPNYMTKYPSPPTAEEPRVFQPTSIIHNGFGGVGRLCALDGDDAERSSRPRVEVRRTPILLGAYPSTPSKVFGAP